MTRAEKIEQTALKILGAGAALWAIIAARESAKRKATEDYYSEKAEQQDGVGKTAKYKLIVEGDYCGQLTSEYANLASNLKEAEKIARELLKRYGKEYDCYVACYPYSENVVYPYSNYRVWYRDYFNDEFWATMRVSDYGTRLGIRV